MMAAGHRQGRGQRGGVLQESVIRLQGSSSQELRAGAVCASVAVAPAAAAASGTLGQGSEISPSSSSSCRCRTAMSFSRSCRISSFCRQHARNHSSQYSKQIQQTCQFPHDSMPEGQYRRK